MFWLQLATHKGTGLKMTPRISENLHKETTILCKKTQLPLIALCNNDMVKVTNLSLMVPAQNESGITSTPGASEQNGYSNSLNRILSFSFLAGSFGILLDLLLMNHYEGYSQSIPILLLSFSSIIFIANLALRTKWLLKTFKYTLVILTVCAVSGVYFHFAGKAAFKTEIDPSLEGWNLILTCITGHSLPPVLAPGSIILVVLFGYAWAVVNTNKYISNKTYEKAK